MRFTLRARAPFTPVQSDVPEKLRAVAGGLRTIIAPLVRVTAAAELQLTPENLAAPEALAEALELRADAIEAILDAHNETKGAPPTYLKRIALQVIKETGPPLKACGELFKSLAAPRNQRRFIGVARGQIDGLIFQLNLALSDTRTIETKLLGKTEQLR